MQGTSSLAHVAVTVEMFREMTIAMQGEKHLLLDSRGDQLFEQYRAGLSEIEVVDGVIVAHVTLWRLVDDWFELGTLWTRSNCRSRGIAERLMRAVLQRRRNIMLTTTNPKVWYISEKVGMYYTSFHDLPDSVHQGTCICPPHKIGGCTNQMHCPLKDGECRCYVK